jgi:hypothetical protein
MGLRPTRNELRFCQHTAKSKSDNWAKSIFYFKTNLGHENKGTLLIKKVKVKNLMHDNF